uniref:Uncharacterized protein n=1 Tax=Meloidogyne floridensis TaxID=298350 RepID=A0A915PEU4_9BILA
MIYVYNPEEATRICRLLLFRLILEFLKLMTKNDNFHEFLYLKKETNYLEAKKEEHIKLVDNLIKLFNEYNENPEEFYNLNLNEEYSENTKEKVTKKVEEFIKNYIDEQLKVIVGHLVGN